MVSEKQNGVHGSEKTEEAITGTPIQATQYGVYRIITEVPPLFSPTDQWNKATRTVPTLVRLTKDVCLAGPRVFFLFLATQLWHTGVEPTLTLHLSSRILSVIEDGLRKGHPDSEALFRAVALHFMCLALTAVVNWHGRRLKCTMEDCVQLRFQNYVLRHKLGSDLSAVQANLSTEHLSVGSAWVVFSSTIEASTALVGILAQLGYILGTLRSSGHGTAFFLFCLAQPALEFAFQRALFFIPSVVDANNPHFLRMRSLRELREQKFRQEIITGDLVGYVLQEFRRAVKLLGDTDVSGPLQQYARHSSSIPDLVTQLAGDLPMLYYAANAIWTPTKFSLASVATLHKSEQLLSWTFLYLSYSIRPAMRLINSVKMIYDLDHAAKQKEDGHLVYPPAGSPHAEGMPIELRNVSFSYPGAATKALDNVSLSLKAGQLIVIVGANGSGKSTVVKLLTRLYDATDGAVMIDGEDIKNYKTADVRRATASLTQDHQLYPLSLGENIGLGNPEQVTDLDMVRAAAKLGGAESVIAKQPEGLATVLKRPAGAIFSVSVHGTGNTPLSAEWERLRKNADVSGGERQRIAAARTFMRFTSNAVKLVCVDEPSANLDPEAEQELFNNLRAARAGKTTIFITHRFGHLTKHADLLVCMKDGTIAETGTHEELLALKGEYFKMYIIQAEAFN